MQLSPETEALVDRLVEVHGEGGICPTADDWRSILRFDPGGPIFILNLLKFKQTTSVSGETMSGSSAYDRYAIGVAPAFARAGGKQVFFGRVGHSFPDSADVEWDAAIVTRYPSPRALADMWLDSDFIEAHEHRVDGVEQSRVLIFSDPRMAQYGSK
jgi:hypothetical protein